jgi:hypothetical protein
MEKNDQLDAPAALTAGSAPATHWIGGYVGPRADLDALEKSFFSLTEKEPKFLYCPASNLVTSL